MTITARYDRHARAYETHWAPVLAPTALAMLDALDLELGDRVPRRVLDVGVGTGTLTRSAVMRWPTATVVAVDGSAGMLAEARASADRTLPPEGLRRIEWQAALAERLPYPDRSFDVAVSSFVYQLVPDRPAALREAYRILEPGGTLGLVIWLADDTPFDPESAFEAALDHLELGEEDVAEDARSGDPPSAAALAAQLRRCGFDRIRTRTGTLVHRWSLESYLRFLLAYDARDVFRSLERRDRGRLEAEVRRRLADLPADAFEWRAPVVRAFARRPG
jgi:SAM-dependent methyltransferase